MGRSRKMKAKTRIKRQEPIAETSIDPLLSQFTMRQTARHTEGRRNLWSGSRLRHHAVTFVSAGDMRSEELDHSKPVESNNEAQIYKISSASDECEAREDTPRLSTDASDKSLPPTWAADSTYSGPLSSLDDSSEDEIVFHGRNRLRKLAQDVQDHPGRTGPDFIRAVPHATSDIEYRKEHHSGENPSITPTGMASTSDTTVKDRHLPMEHSPCIAYSEGPDYLEIALPAKRRPRRTHTDDQSAVMDDYIANIDDDYQDMLNIYGMQCGIDPAEPDVRSPPPSSSSTSIRDLASPFESDEFPHTRGCYMVSDEDFLIESEKEQFSLQQDITSGPSSESHATSKGRCLNSCPVSTKALELGPLCELDLMGLNETGPKKKKTKRKQGPIDPILSDSELELKLEKAWQNDRQKKKARKQKREELRFQGLLGREAGKPDLKTKYSDGMDIDDFKIETKRFLLSSKTSLSLPPMNKQQRKLVHDVAGALSLKSQSRGRGPSRFPVLQKTGRTPVDTQSIIRHVDKIFTGGKFNCRLAKSWNQKAGDNPGKGRRGRIATGASYMDGDVVGASAPEIGAGNKGRAILEKMGWSSGTALGATNNKGILLPVPHVVKNSRTGLG